MSDARTTRARTATPPLRGASRTWPWREIALGAVLVVAVILVYTPAMKGSYIWDDPRYVSENPVLRDPGGLGKIWTKIGATVQYYPLVFTTFWLEYRLWGLNPVGFHVVNILLHGLSAVLLWLLLKRLKIPGAWLAAAVFALHPLQVESVAWITERKNVLAGVFYLAAALAYLRFDPLDADDAAARRDWRFYGLALGCFLLALFSKTVTASLPAALLLVAWWKTGRLTIRRVLPTLPMFAVGAVMAKVTTVVEATNVKAVGHDWDLDFLQRILIAGRAVWFYLWKLLVPVKLTFNYPRWTVDASSWWQWVFPLAAGALIVVLWALRRRIGRAPLVAALFFGGTLLPALGFTDVYPMRYSFVADHFQYLAAIGPIALGCALLVRWLTARTRPAGRAATRRDAPAGLPSSLRLAGGALIVILGGLSLAQARIYEDRTVLWRDTLAKNPDSFLAHNNLGTIELDHGQLDAAIADFSAAVRIKPDFHEAQSNLGRALAAKGDLAAAEAHCREAVRIKPDSADAHYNLGNVLAQQKKFAEATTEYEAAIALRPDHAMAQNNLANVLSEQQQFTAAIPHYREAIRLVPRYAMAWRNLGLALSASGDTTAAIDTYRRALRMQPNDAIAHCNLGELLAARGDTDGARQELTAALRLQPRLGAAHDALQKLDAATGGANRPPGGS